MPNQPSRLRLGVAACAFVLTAACTDRHPLATTAPAPSEMKTLECSADVATRTLSCTTPPPATTSGARANVIMGGQDVYVKLASVSSSYDAGTQVFQTNVTVQNLVKQSLGTSDGVTVQGVRVFFASGPTATSGSGTIEVINETGEELFLGSSQPYFQYNEILAPYQISSALPWQFSVPNTVGTFRFTVYVSAPMVDESTSLLDRVWSGMVSGAWALGGNWEDGAAPDSSSAVGIPNAALMTGPNMPVLGADERVTHLRVGAASTLGLAGFTLRADGNVDAVGTIGGGTTWMTGTNTLLRGNVDALRVTGSTRLQGGTRATGAVSVQDGSLTVKDQALSISIP